MKEKRNWEALDRCGRALYGQNWKNQLAKKLDINPTRIRDWRAGRLDIPPGVWDKIIAILKKRRIDIDNVLSEIE